MIFFFSFADARGYEDEEHEGLTDSYHNGGSIVVFAPSLEEAETKLRLARPKLSWKELRVSGPLADMQVFPDAGCC